MPAISGDLLGAVVALLITVAYIALLLALLPFVDTSDQFLAVCSNGLLFLVILLSVLLKMDAAYISKQAAEGLDPYTASVVLVTSNVLVVVMSVVAYYASARRGHIAAKSTHLFSSLQEPLCETERHTELHACSTAGNEEETEQACSYRELLISATSGSEET